MMFLMVKVTKNNVYNAINKIAKSKITRNDVYDSNQTLFEYNYRTK